MANAVSLTEASWDTLNQHFRNLVVRGHLHERGSVRAFAIRPKRHHKPQSQICKKRTRDGSRLKTQRPPLEPVGKFWPCAYLDQTWHSFVHRGEHSYRNL